MKRNLLCCVIILILHNFGFSYLTIDTNILTNITDVTNVSYEIVEEPEVPTSYLKTGKIEFQEPETILRRFDIIFFVSIPITFYLTLNIVQILNREIYNNSQISTTDWNYIYLNTLVIPIFVAFEDAIFIEKQKSANNFCSSHPNINFGLQIVRAKF